MKCQRCRERTAVVIVYAAAADLDRPEGRISAKHLRESICEDCVPSDAIRITQFAFQERGGEGRAQGAPR